MPDFSTELSRCRDLQSVLDRTLAHALAVTQTGLGNLQLFDWPARRLEIRAQRGFDAEFLSFFARVTVGDGTACARALAGRGPVIVEDVTADRDFAPFRGLARRSGFQAVQSTPLVSAAGTVVGVLSTHFPARHRPSAVQLDALRVTARVAADAIQRRQGLYGGRPLALGYIECAIAETQDAIETSRALLRLTRETLSRSEESVASLQYRIGRSADLLRRSRRRDEA